MSVQRAQYEITSSEFVDWIVFLDDEPNRFHREDHYLAQIAAEIRKTIVKKPEKVKLQSFLMKFVKGKKDDKKKETLKEASSRMKTIFGAMFGIKKGKK